jgi:glycosyltransferase involved in cell wall biosynthesis
MKVYIFLLCYNEEVMMPNTLQYYKTRFPDAEITIFDNYSTDRSCEIAEAHGCRIKKFETKGQQNEKDMMWIRSNMWKEFVCQGWVIMCDMDEWLDITEAQLIEEDQKGTTILTTQGVNVLGEGTREDLADLDFFAIQRGFYDNNMSKRICFKYPSCAVEYWWGAHTCFPQGHVVFSTTTYLMRHYNYLGEAYLVRKHANRWSRNVLSRNMGLNQHYHDDQQTIRDEYQGWVKNAQEIPPLIGLTKL